MKHVVYFRPDGAIASVSYVMPDIFEILQARGEAVVEIAPEDGISDRTHYVDVARQVVVPKVPMTPTVVGLTVRGLPRPCLARVAGQVVRVAGGVLELDPELPGPYAVTLTAPAYLDCTVSLG